MVETEVRAKLKAALNRPEVKEKMKASANAKWASRPDLRTNLSRKRSAKNSGQCVTHQNHPQRNPISVRLRSQKELAHFESLETA
jgi:hypothetical protein